jgi:uncharacterized protein YndB with AHSA1/START domain
MDITHATNIASTPERLYEALTTERGLAGWWTPDVTAQPRVGGVNTFHFGLEARLAWRVDELVPGRRVAWSSIEGPPEWDGTRLLFDIAPIAGRTDLRFTHAGLPDGYTDYAGFAYLWGQYVRSIKLLLETGTGEPYGSAASRAAGTTPA